MKFLCIIFLCITFLDAERIIINGEELSKALKEHDRNLNREVVIYDQTSPIYLANKKSLNELENILIQIKKHFFPLDISLVLTNPTSPIKEPVRAMAIDTIQITKDFIVYFRNKQFSIAEKKAIMCHEVSHILSHDTEYLVKHQKNNIKIQFTTNIHVRIKYYTAEGQALEGSLGYQDEDYNLTNFDVNTSQVPFGAYRHDIETEKNADVLALDCLNKLKIRNGKEVLKGMLRTFKQLRVGDVDRLDKRLKALDEL